MANFFFNVPIKSKEEIYGNIVEMSENNNYTTGYLLNYEYFSNHYKLIATDVSKQADLGDGNTKDYKFVK